jgi:hypothetical protein
MRLFAIGDLHLSGGDDKPMDVFGPQWDRHFFHISEKWREKVRKDDLVLVPGDISWAMHLEDARKDLEQIATLPGRIILCKGNHDYWWNSISRVRAILPANMQALQFSAADVGTAVVCGTRGWLFPTRDQELDEANRKIFTRETQRLRMALEEARNLAAGRPIVTMMHYPPLLTGERETAFTELLEEFGVHTVVYGHLHGQGIQSGFSGEYHGIQYELVSCDSIDFSPKEIKI